MLAAIKDSADPQRTRDAMMADVLFRLTQQDEFMAQVSQQMGGMGVTDLLKMALPFGKRGA